MHLAKVHFDRASSSRIETLAPDVLLTFPGAGLAAMRRTKALKVFHAVDAHPRHHNASLLAHYAPRTCRAELYPEWLVRRIESELEVADLILVPSQIVSTGMIQHGVDPRKIVVEPYGVDFELFRPLNSGKTSQRRRPQVIYVGQFSRRKGLSFLVAAARSANVDITLLGTAFDPSVLINMPANVRIAKPTDHQGLARRLAEADALVIPTLEDACSLVAFEAAAAGLPVLTTTVNGAIEALPAAAVRLVDPGNVDQLASALDNVDVLSGDSRKLIAAATRESAVRDWSEYGATVLTRFGWPKLLWPGASR